MHALGVRVQRILRFYHAKVASIRHFHDLRLIFMPRTLKADPKLTLLGRLSVMTLLKFLMLREEVSYRDLAEKLNRLGFEENERNLRNKITKGEMPAALFLILMRLLKAKSFPIEELPILQTDIEYPEPPPTEKGP